MYFFGAAGPAQPTAATEPNASLLLGDLAPGEQAIVRITAVAQTAAISAEIVASTQSAAMDSQRANNVARLVQPIESSQVENRVDTLRLPAVDLAYDSVSSMLYLANGGFEAGVSNVLIAVDPARGTIERQVALPGLPGRLAISGGGEFLYVSLDGAQRIARLRLPGLETDQVFLVVSNVFSPQCDLLVLPGAPHSLAVSRFGGGVPSPAGVWIFDDGQARPLSAPAGYDGVTWIEPGLTPDQLIALDEPTSVNRQIRRLLVTGQGVTVESQSHGPINGSAFEFAVAGTNILLNGGQLHDLATLAQRSILPIPFAPQAFALSANGDRAVFAAGSNRAVDPVDFTAFRTDTFEPLGSARGGDLPVAVQRLILWGTDGIAALADGWLILGRLDLAGPPTRDTDGDGMPDRWESDHGLKPLLNDALEDTDGDGSNNLQEYFFGTDPKSADSVPRLDLNLTGANQLRLVFSCAGGRHFVVEQTFDLSSGPWTTNWESVAAGGLQVVDVGSVIPARGFFRVVVRPE
jgi:hypothetical protein